MTEDLCTRLSRLRSSGSSFEDLLAEAVRALHDSNPRFHWTGIYELFPDDVLRLGPFLGAPTDHVFIGVGSGVCGTAVAERRNINIPDVAKLENYLACSTETRSELVVLIRGERDLRPDRHRQPRVRRLRPAGGARRGAGRGVAGRRVRAPGDPAARALRT